MHMSQLLFLLFKNAKEIVGKSVELYDYGDVEKKLEVKSCFTSRGAKAPPKSCASLEELHVS